MDTGHKPTPVHASFEDRERTEELRNCIRSELRRRGVDRREIEDETDETFQRVSVKALDKASTFNPDLGNVNVWLKQIAARIIIDEYRRKRKSKVIYGEIVEEPSTSGDSIEDPLADGIPNVRMVLASLPKKHQEVFKYSYEEGMKGKELARALRCSTPGVARVLGFRLRKDFIVSWAKFARRRIDA